MKYITPKQRAKQLDDNWEIRVEDDETGCPGVTLFKDVEQNLVDAVQAEQNRFVEAFMALWADCKDRPLRDEIAKRLVELMAAPTS